MAVGSHLEEGLIKKIENGEFVDFAKLIPKDKIIAETDETKLKLVIHEGKTFYVPAKGNSVITGFRKWEQASRVYSNIYTRKHPTRVTELIQYNHVIHTASHTYVWNNVYAYDQDFRIHMSKHPGRSWAILLQQSWSMRLQDRVHFNDFYKHVRHGHQREVMLMDITNPLHLQAVGNPVASIIKENVLSTIHADMNISVLTVSNLAILFSLVGS